MKTGKAAVRSFKNLISKTRANKRLSPNTNFGETLVPIGPSDLFIELPTLRNTYTYNIINTAEMIGNITLKTSKGASLKGLILNTMNGNISIDPIGRGVTSFEIGSDVKDGCFVQTISNGDKWFIWSVSTNGTLSFSREGAPSESGDGSSESTLPVNVIVDSITAETTFPDLQASHDLLISGRAEPGSTITISEDNGAIQPFTVQVASDGTWSTNAITNLSNGSYSFDFVGSVGEPALNQIFADNTGALTFTTPSSFTVERGESFNFSTGAFALDPSGNQIATFFIDDSDYDTNLAHGETFVVVYSFTYNSQTYTRTVSGTVVDTAGPEAPVNNPPTINGNTFAIDGTAEPGSTVSVYFGGGLQGTTTADPVTGDWSFEKELTFNQTIEVTTQATDAQGNIGDESDPVAVVFSPDYPTVTLEMLNANHNGWTNVANPIQIAGKTNVGAAVTVYNGSQLATLASGPTVDGAGNWTATMNVANESITILTAKASLNGYSSNGSSSPRTALVDREVPTIQDTPLQDITVYLGDIGADNDNIPTATDFSPVTVTSDWDEQVDATESAKTVAYTATDAAGNTSTATRVVNVTTQVIVPVIDTLTDNGDGTVTVEGTVAGSYADNLTVQVLVDNLDDGAPVSVENGLFNHRTTNLGSGTFAITAISVNSIGEESSLSNEETITLSVVDTSSLFVEENLEITDLSGSATLVSVGDNIIFQNTNGATTGHALTNWSDHIVYNSNEGQFDDVTTLSLWFKLGEGVTIPPNSNNFIEAFYIIGSVNLTIRIYNASGHYNVGVQYRKNNGTGGNVGMVDSGIALETLRQWCNISLVIPSGQSALRTYFNGEPGNIGADASPSLVGNLTNEDEQFAIGAQNVSGTRPRDFLVELDSIQFSQGTVLSGEQVSYIFSQDDRQTTIEEASQLDLESPIITITKNSDGTIVNDEDSITLNVGDVFEDLYTIEVTDNSGEQITPVISPVIDTSSITGPNDHTITATDSTGNTSEITLSIEVVGLWTETFESPIGAFYEDLSYSPSGITMVDGLSTDRYTLGAEMDRLTIDMNSSMIDGQGYEVIVNIRPVDTPITRLDRPAWTSLTQSDKCPLFIGFLRASDNYTFGWATNRIPVNTDKNTSYEWLGGVFYQTRFSDTAATGAEMAYYNQDAAGSGRQQSSSFLSLEPTVSSQILKDRVRQVRYTITKNANRIQFTIDTKLPEESSWTSLAGSGVNMRALGVGPLHLAIVGQTFPNGSIVQDITVTPIT